MTANRTISINNAVADGASLGAAAFVAADFNSSAGIISLDYTNGQKASGSQPGFLSSADWTTFNNKQPAGNYIINSGNSISWTEGLYSARPAFGTAGRYYTALDSAAIFYDNGSSWTAIGRAAGGGGGSGTRFGVSGEDDATIVDRAFDLNTHTFAINASTGDLSYSFIDGSNTGLWEQEATFMATTISDGTQQSGFDIQATHYLMATTLGDASVYGRVYTYVDSVVLNQKNGTYFVYNLPYHGGDTTNFKNMLYDPVNMIWAYGDASGGGGGQNMANADLTADASHTTNYNQNEYELINAGHLSFVTNTSTNDTTSFLRLHSEVGDEPYFYLNAPTWAKQKNGRTNNMKSNFFICLI
jgi:hypothetical protein